MHVDAATLAAIGTIIVGLAAAAAALIGQRAGARATHHGAVMTGYGGLVNELQEERAAMRAELAKAYDDLARERADKVALQLRVAELEAGIADRDRQIAALRRTVL